MCANVLSAQSSFNPPTKEINWFGGNGDDYSSADDAERGTGIRRSQGAPIAPATLLLLGLGGAAVGTTVIRNSKKGDK